jgi:uncharacterized protein YbjT (DUF2867 family)
MRNPTHGAASRSRPAVSADRNETWRGDRGRDEMTVLLAGATGTLGRHLLTELDKRPEPVRALVRTQDRAQRLSCASAQVAVADLANPHADLRSACEDVHTVISAAGRSCSTRRLPERGAFTPVDYEGNRRLLQAAIGAGAQRFLYVSVLGAQRLRGLEYIDAHERFVELLQDSPIQSTIVRANGFFASYLEMFDIVTSPGPASLIGDGTAKDNPIHEADLAIACLDALDHDRREVEVGGPQAFTRREELELVCQALGKTPRIIRTPPSLLRTGAKLMRPFDKRRAAAIQFITTICTIDLVGPPNGHHRLGEYLQAAAAEIAGAGDSHDATA